MMRVSRFGFYFSYMNKTQRILIQNLIKKHDFSTLSHNKVKNGSVFIRFLTILWRVDHIFLKKVQKKASTSGAGFVLVGEKTTRIVLLCIPYGVVSKQVQCNRLVLHDR